MAEVLLRRPQPPNPQSKTAEPNLGFVFDDVGRRLVGLYGDNPSQDQLTVRLWRTANTEPFTLDLPPLTTVRQTLLLPRAAQLRERVIAAGVDPRDPELKQRPERRTIPFTKLAVDRRFHQARGDSPTVESVTQSEFNVDTATPAVDLPATVNAGDLLLMVFGFSNIDFASNNMTAPTGWTEKYDEQYDSSGSRNGIAVFGLDAAGSEDGGTATVGVEDATACSAQVYRISDWSGDLADVTWAAASPDGESAAANPPAHTPAGGSADYLWVAVGCLDDTTSGASAAPTNYTGLTNTSGSATEAHSLFTARRGLEASSENPGTFTNFNEKWVAATGSIAPSAGGTLHEATATTSITVSGTAAGKKTGKATAATSVAATGAGTAHAVRKATAASSVTVTGSAAGKSQPQRATATTSITVAGAGTAKKTAKTTAATSITVSGSATGKKTAKTTGASSVTVTATASGEQVVPPETATASTSISVTATASGKKTAKTTGAATVTVTTTGLGWVPREHDTGPVLLEVTAPIGILDVEEV